MSNIRVSVINASKILSDAQVEAVVPALQKQVSLDFAPVWGIDATLMFVPRGASPGANTWWLAILDDSDQANALGYHETTDTGLPLAKVFAKTARQDGVQWTVTASHELLEMLADPEINLTVFVQPTATAGTLYAYEVCDACEADEFGYKIDGTLVSDFVYPTWFESFQPRGATQFCHSGKLTAPLPELLPGGYIGAFDVGSGTGWHQITAMGARAAHGARPPTPADGARRNRRAIPRSQWQRSKVDFPATAPAVALHK